MALQDKVEVMERSEPASKILYYTILKTQLTNEKIELKVLKGMGTWLICCEHLHHLVPIEFLVPHIPLVQDELPISVFGVINPPNVHGVRQVWIFQGVYILYSCVIQNAIYVQLHPTI